MKWFQGNYDGRRDGLICAKNKTQAAEIAEISIHLFHRDFHVMDPRPEYEGLQELRLYTKLFEDKEWQKGICPAPPAPQKLKRSYAFS